jgi:hypothetical protein
LCGCIGAYRVGKVERAFNRKNAVYARACIEFDVSGARRSALQRRSCPVLVVELMPTTRRGVEYPEQNLAGFNGIRGPSRNVDISIEVARWHHPEKWIPVFGKTSCSNNI